MRRTWPGSPCRPVPPARMARPVCGSRVAAIGLASRSNAAATWLGVSGEVSQSPAPSRSAAVSSASASGRATMTTRRRTLAEGSERVLDAAHRPRCQEDDVLRGVERSRRRAGCKRCDGLAHRLHGVAQHRLVLGEEKEREGIEGGRTQPVAGPTLARALAPSAEGGVIEEDRAAPAPARLAQPVLAGMGDVPVDVLAHHLAPLGWDEVENTRVEPEGGPAEVAALVRRGRQEERRRCADRPGPTPGVLGRGVEGEAGPGGTARAERVNAPCLDVDPGVLATQPRFVPADRLGDRGLREAEGAGRAHVLGHPGSLSPLRTGTRPLGGRGGRCGSLIIERPRAKAQRGIPYGGAPAAADGGVRSSCRRPR
jgi:hypothetical protein